MLRAAFISTLFTACLAIPRCSKEFAQCYCGEEEYIDKRQYVVNCTDTGFTSAAMLQNLPPQTQVLIFTGNNISELPINVFGIQNNSNLRVVDMSNNHIKVIRGKTFHHVSSVERLILNHNEISISSDNPTQHHPRVFSNFESLIELHLTNAFAKDLPPDGLAADLHDIFVSSELGLLRKLHLEQNKISQFKDERVFCDLPSLQDLHLSQNNLHGIHFEVSCLNNLRFIDLESNFIYTLTPEELSELDSFPQRNHSLMIDLSDNHFSCECDELYGWLNTTKVVVRNKNKLHCHRSAKGEVNPHCTQKILMLPNVVVKETGSFILISVLFIALCVSVALNVYTNRDHVRRTLIPAFHTVTKKVHYTTIGKPEDPEMDV